MGMTVIFAANKGGHQGAIGLAEEAIEQLRQPLMLPNPIDFANPNAILNAVEYFQLEYGDRWVGSQALRAGVVLHHGDLPQETREVAESLVRNGHVKFAICTNTLAEGVNLPIRTLVLYSVQRHGKSGRPESLLTRDIKNLVGRAGRAGATTKGLVICVNEQQWPLVEQVALQASGERVVGALRSLLVELRAAVEVRNFHLTNANLEHNPRLHTLVDGIDYTLIDLAAEEVGEEELTRIAVTLADETFASQQADATSKLLLQQVFELRARRIIGLRTTGRLNWIRETGARARIIESVESGLAPSRNDWSSVTDSLDSNLVTSLLEWAWAQRELQLTAREAYRIGDNADVNTAKRPFFEMVGRWLSGASFVDIAIHLNVSIDELLAIHTRVVTFGLQSLLEQGIALLAKVIESGDPELLLAPAVIKFPEHLRFGVPTQAGCTLAAGGVRHRRAAVELGSIADIRDLSIENRALVFSVAREHLVRDRTDWQARLGRLVFEHTIQDLES